MFVRAHYHFKMIIEIEMSANTLIMRNGAFSVAKIPAVILEQCLHPSAVYPERDVTISVFLMNAACQMSLIDLISN